MSVVAVVMVDQDHPAGPRLPHLVAAGPHPSYNEPHARRGGASNTSRPPSSHRSANDSDPRMTSEGGMPPAMHANDRSTRKSTSPYPGATTPSSSTSSRTPMLANRILPPPPATFGSQPDGGGDGTQTGSQTSVAMSSSSARVPSPETAWRTAKNRGPNGISSPSRHSLPPSPGMSYSQTSSGRKKRSFDDHQAGAHAAPPPHNASKHYHYHQHPMPRHLSSQGYPHEAGGHPSTSYVPPYTTHQAYGAVATAPPRYEHGPGAPGGVHVEHASQHADISTDSQGARKAVKVNVRVACSNCKRAHLACDSNRPCGRCVRIHKADSCVDVQHKKRGRPRSERRLTSDQAEQEGQGEDGGAQGYAGEEQHQRSASPQSVGGLPGKAGSQARTKAGHGRRTDEAQYRHGITAPSYPSPPPPGPGQAGAGAYERQPYAAQHHQQQQQQQQQWRTARSLVPSRYSGNGGAHPPSPAMVDPSQTSAQVAGVMGPPPAYHGPSPRSAAAALAPPPPSAPAPRSGYSTGAPPSPMYHIRPSPVMPGFMANLPSTSPVLTMICSTDLHIVATATEGSRALLGFEADELRGASLLDLVHPEDGPLVRRMWAALVEHAQIRPQSGIRSLAEGQLVLTSGTQQLLQPARGTIFPEEEVRLQLSNGLFDLYSVRLHIGGFWGADLFVHESKEQAYIVASLLKLGNQGSHPDVYGRPPVGGIGPDASATAGMAPAPAPGVPSPPSRPA